MSHSSKWGSASPPLQYVVIAPSAEHGATLPPKPALAQPLRAWHDQGMVPKLYISKIEPGLYEAHLTDGGQDICEPSAHSTIAEALLHVGQDVPDDFAHFVDVHYSGGSIGTTALTRLATESEVIANELVALAAALYESEEELAFQRAKRTSATSS